MAYRIQYSPTATRQLRKLARDVQKRLKTDIEALRDNSRPPGCKRYRHEPGAYRIRSGSYRVVYEVEDDVFTILILKLGHRRDIYA